MKAKKTAALLLAALMMISLAACGSLPSTAESAPPETAGPSAQTQATEPSAVAEPSAEPSPTAEPTEPPVEYPILTPYSESANVDLNMDGSADIVSVSMAEDAYGYPCNFAISVNGVDYSASVYNQGFFSDCPFEDFFAITDIDSSDDCLELALMDWGPSDDLITSFFRYDGESLIYMGKVSGLIQEEGEKGGVTFSGDGIIHSYVRLSVLQTWFADVDWVLGETGFMVVPQAVYYSNQTFDVTANAELLAYSEMDTASGAVTIPSGAALTITGTDNQSWVLAQYNGGDVWFHMVNGWELEGPSGEAIQAWQAFTGLCMAD